MTSMISHINKLLYPPIMIHSKWFWTKLSLSEQGKHHRVVHKKVQGRLGDLAIDTQQDSGGFVLDGGHILWQGYQVQIIGHPTTEER